MLTITKFDCARSCHYHTIVKSEKSIIMVTTRRGGDYSTPEKNLPPPVRDNDDNNRGGHSAPSTTPRPSAGRCHNIILVNSKFTRIPFVLISSHVPFYAYQSEMRVSCLSKCAKRPFMFIRVCRKLKIEFTWNDLLFQRRSVL